MRKREGAGPNREAGAQPDGQAIREEVERVLADPAFAKGTRRRDLLRFLVEETLAGRGSGLKGFSIATEVFGRDDDFDAKADPVVRLEARRLRRDLDSYYAGTGAASPLRLSIPKGAYAVHATSALAAGPPAEPTAPEAARPPSRLPRRALVGLVPLVVVLALLVIGLDRNPMGAQTASMSSRPGIAVEPFDLAGASGDEAGIAMGIGHQIVADLMRFPDVRVYAAENGEALPEAVRFRVEGALRLSEDQVDLTARLVDVGDGQVIWSETFERDYSVDSIFAIEDEIAASIATAVGQPYGAVRNYLVTEMPDHVPSLESYQCVLAGYSYRRTFADGLAAPLMECLTTTVAREPDYPEAWAMLAYMHLDAARFGRATGAEKGAAFNRALEAASRGTTLDPENGLAVKALAAVHFYRGDFAEAELWAVRAVELNPNDPDALVQLGWRRAIRGDFDGGLPFVERAIERSIAPPGWYFHMPTLKAYLDGDIERMLALARRAMVDGSGISHSLLAIAQGEAGDADAAQRSLERMATVYPDMWPDPLVGWRRHHASGEILAAVSRGFAKAGAPVTAAMQ